MSAAERATWRADWSESLHDAAARWGVMDPERPALDGTHTPALIAWADASVEQTSLF